MARNGVPLLVAALLGTAAGAGLWRWSSGRRTESSPGATAALVAEPARAPPAAPGLGPADGKPPPAAAPAGTERSSGAAASTGAVAGEEAPARRPPAAAAPSAPEPEREAQAGRVEELQAESARRISQLEAQLAALRARDEAHQQQLTYLRGRLATLQEQLSVLESQRQAEAASPRIRAGLAEAALANTQGAAQLLAQGSSGVGANLDAAQELLTRLRDEAARFGVGAEADQARAAAAALARSRAFLDQKDLYNAGIWLQVATAAIRQALATASEGAGAGPAAAGTTSGGY